MFSCVKTKVNNHTQTQYSILINTYSSNFKVEDPYVTEVNVNTKEELVKYIIALEILKKQFSNDTHGCDMDFTEKMCLHIPIVSDLLLINSGIDWRRDYDFDMPDMLDSYEVFQRNEDGTKYRLSNIILRPEFQKMVDDAPVFQMDESEGKVDLYHLPDLHECDVDSIQEDIEDFYECRAEEEKERLQRVAEMETQIVQYANEKAKMEKRLSDLARDIGVDVDRINRMSQSEVMDEIERMRHEFEEWEKEDD